MKIEIEKIKQIVIYLKNNIKDLDIIKLSILFYYIDFISVLETGEPITNDVYCNTKYCPMPLFTNYKMSDFLFLWDENKMKEDLSSFSIYQQKLLKDVLNGLKRKTTDNLIKQVLKEKPSLLTEIDNVIDYSYAFDLDVKSILKNRKYDFDKSESKSKYYGIC